MPIRTQGAVPQIQEVDLKTGSRLSRTWMGGIAVAACGSICYAQGQASLPASDESVRALIRIVQAQELRIEELEKRLAASPVNSSDASVRGFALIPAVEKTPMATPASGSGTGTATTSVPGAEASTPSVPVSGAQQGMPADHEMSMDDPHDHMLNLPGGGPTLKIRGYTDINFDVGKNANPLIYPSGAPGYKGFQLGEFDLFMSSKLSDHLSVIGELVIGTDATNYWGIDMERVQLTYRANRYLEVSAGRYHTAIGYYNTMFHHGSWFQTATGRPFMYYFEDSGGLLPVHNVGVTTTGLVPGTKRVGLHWIAEVGNGRSSSLTGEPVQNFASDRSGKSVNFAAFVKPEFLEGLQIGGGRYYDVLNPAGIGPVHQSIYSAYAVYNNNKWEWLNEAVVLRDRVASGRIFESPMAYTQLSRRLGQVQPYFRYQFVNAISGDPLNVFQGRYQGPSFGIRRDLSAYAALKFQYNRLYQSNVLPLNGFDTQIAFTF